MSEERVSAIPLSEPAEWEAALRGIPHAYGHTWASCSAMQLTSAAPVFLFVWESHSGRIVAPFQERSHGGYTDVFTPYGFSGFSGRGDFPAAIAAWRHFALERGYVCAYIGLNPVLCTASHFSGVEVYEYNDVHVIDLRKTEGELHAALSSNRRRQLREVRDSEELFAIPAQKAREFIASNLSGFYEQRGAGAAYRWSPATISRLLADPNSVVVAAGPGGEVCAASLFLYTEYAAEYFAGVSIGVGKRWSAHLIWLGALELRRRGIPLLNLGGGVVRGDGVAGFKERFGAQRLPLAAVKQVFRPDIYKFLCETVGADPNDVAGYFPPYHRGAAPTASGSRDVEGDNMGITDVR